jgi:hypothetical protein
MSTSAIIVILVLSESLVILLEPALKREHVRVDSGIASRVSIEETYVGVGVGSGQVGGESVLWVPSS